MRFATLSFALLLTPLSVLRAGDGAPPFSWDKVPLFADVGKRSDDFSEAELDFLAKHYSIVSIEKGHAFKKHGQTEQGVYTAAKELKRRNPVMKVLFYWNVSLDYRLYQASAAVEQHPGWLLKSRDGRPLLVRNEVRCYDQSNVAFRGWWTDVAATAMKAAPLDGVFVDALNSATSAARRRELGTEKFKAVRQGVHALLRETQQKIGPDRLLMINGLRAGVAAPFLEECGGLMLEHFGYFESGTKERMAADLEIMQRAARAGKVAVLKGWPGFFWFQKEAMARPHEELARLARERITFPLACFLVAAEKNCFFSYTWGYTEWDGTFESFPELDKPLGPPQGEAKRDGWTYRREFAHALVSVDLETKTARIDWR